MKVYPKILLATLPFLLLTVLSAVGTSYYFSTAGLTAMADEWLGARLFEAVQVVRDQEELLKQYGMSGLSAGRKLVKMDAATTLSTMKVGQEGCILVISDTGRMIVYPDRTLVGKDVGNLDWFQEMVKKKKGGFFFRYQNEGRLARYDFIPSWKWYVLATAPESEVYGGVRKTSVYALLMGGLGGLVMAGVLMLLTRRLLLPLGLLENGVKAVSQGRLDTQIPVTTRDELASLAKGFNHMTGKIQAALDEIQRKERLFRSLTENATDVVVLLDDRDYIIYASRSIEARTGYGAEEFLGYPAANRLLESEQGKFDRFLKEMKKDPGRKCREEFSCRHKSGRILTFDVIGRDQLNDPAVQGMVFNARDITECKLAENAVRESEERYRDLFDNISDFIYTHDLSGRLLSINRVPAESLGYQPEELIGKTVADLMPEKYQAAFYEEYLPQIQRKGQHRSLSLYLQRNGEAHYLEAYNQLVYEEGKETYVRGSARDITSRIMREKEHKRVEIALKESEERYRIVLDASPDPIAVYDLHGKTIYVNDAFSRVFGWQPHELFTGKCPFIPPEEQTMRGFLADMVSQGQTVFGVETRRRCRDGSIVDVSISAAPFYDRNGEYTGSVVIHRNITEGKRAGEALRESEKRYRTILESSPDPVVLLDVEGIIIYANSAFSACFGWSMEELHQRKIDFFNPEESALALEKIEGLKKGLHFFGFEACMYNRTGDHLEISLSAQVWRDQKGNPAGSVVNFRDITLRKKMEFQLRHAQKMEAVGTLAGGVAHDFNNILQAITGYVQLLLMIEGSNSAVTDHLNQIDHLIQRAAVLISQLLTVSRKMESKLQVVDLGDEVLDICGLLRRTIPKMVEINTDCITSDCLVNADPIQLEQILLNLGNNAVDAMPKGGDLTFTTEVTTLSPGFCQAYQDIQPGRYVSLRVTDTGVGMGPGVVEHIFEPFFTTKGPGKGSGLGLATVYGIVKNHGGLITCHSEPGDGTTFNIYLPAADKNSRLPIKTAGTQVDTPFGRETILLVDDETPILDVGEEILHQFGYSTMRACSGEDALKIYEEHMDLIDLVLLDLGMPGMGGIGALPIILEKNPRAKVVVASGYTSKEQVEEVLTVGAKNFINKPYRLMDMLNKIREVLDQDA